MEPPRISSCTDKRKKIDPDTRKMTEKRQTRVKVVIRVRPPLSTDSKTCVETVGNKVEIFNHRNLKENLQYQFTSVFDKSSKQRDIFDSCVCPLLGHAMNGENVSIFAYGPTGAGKTYTMLGTEDDPGMIPRVIRNLFQSLSSLTNSCSSKVTLSFLEIYNEKVQDLLNPSETDLPIREDASHKIFVAGLKEEVIHSFDDFRNLFGPASNNRTVAATKLNDHSSRSHCIVQLKVDTRRNGQVFHSKIYLIDLAGSEDNRRTGNCGIRLKESGAINRSLFVLGEVVDAINNNLPRIPYRNSKLTRLLQDSIGGSCHSVMITNVAPEETFYYDTYCTLNFASKSRKIINNNVASVSFEKPQGADRGFKRSCSDLQFPDGKSKQPKMSPSVESFASSSAPVPLGPLVTRQDNLEKTVQCCMRKMEDLVQQISHKSTGKSSNPDPAMVEIQRQLLQVQAQLKEIQEQQKNEKKQAEEQKVPEEKPAPERRRSQRKSLSQVPKLDTVLRDKTNKIEGQKVQKDGPSLVSAGRGWSMEDPSCSPLFSLSADSAATKSALFTAGFKSTACKSSCIPDTPRKLKDNAAKFSIHQKKQNEEFLTVLNTAPIKRLQELHTVGVKRARLLFEWRQAHGMFTSFADLKQIPGFTEKYVNSLLQRNFVLTDV